jgi:DNA topoisomerase-1
MPVVRPQDHRLLADGRLAARAAGLRWVSTDEPGLTRLRKGRGFAYRDAAGKRVTDRATLARIRTLAIPPAWTEVWICADPRGHVQACGRDARQRKQFRYHWKWRQVRDCAKHDRCRAFGRVLPKLRAAIDRDLHRDGLGRDTVIAAIVMMMDRGRLRIGNDEYARANGSHGACTLEDDDVRIGRDGVVKVDFVGKGGVRHTVTIEHSRLADVVRACRAIPGRRLFQWCTDDGVHKSVTARDVNAYIRDRTGGSFTAKDFRTWHASRLCERLLRKCGPDAAATARRRTVAQVVKQVAEQLGNTPAVARKSYIDPDVIDGFLAAA